MKSHSIQFSASARNSGFTLIELMLAIAIVGILGAIAVPAYKDYLVRGRVPSATSALAGKQVQLEQFFQDNKKYTGAPACTADSTTSPYFDFSCTTLTDTAFTLQAQGKSTMTGFTYTVDQNNTKTTAAVPSGWTAHTPNNCWVTNKGGVC
jgi:type IV pilus assembly protein PilE